MRRTVIVLAALVLTTPILTAPALAAPTTVATPVSTWQASFEDGLCRMERSFEAGGQPHLLILEQNSPGSGFGLAMAGPSLSALTSDKPLRLSFARDDDGFERRTMIEPNDQFGHVAVFTGIWIGSSEGPDDDASKPSNRSRIDPDAAARANQIAVSQGDAGVIFDTGALADAALVLNECTAQIARTWGLDPEVQYGLVQRAFPADPKALAQKMQKSYPRGAARALRSGPLEAAALVDSNGAVTDCKIIVPTGYDDLDQAACEVMTQARYTPALDANGRPVASYWKTRVTFLANAFEAEQRKP